MQVRQDLLHSPIILNIESTLRCMRQELLKIKKMKE